jgi:hypothetical protein
MLITPPIANKKTRAYLDHLKNLIAENPRIKILPPKKPSEIVEFITAYDIGVFLIPPINFNYANTLPNKLFDFIQARLTIAIGPTPEMAEIVNTFNIGVVAEEFTPQALAKKINALTRDEIQKFKENSVQAAATLHAENNGKMLRELIAETLKQS